MSGRRVCGRPGALVVVRGEGSSHLLWERASVGLKKVPLLALLPKTRGGLTYTPKQPAAVLSGRPAEPVKMISVEPFK